MENENLSLLVSNYNTLKPITSLIDNKILEDQKKKLENQNITKIYPSSVHKCSRALCFELLGYKKPELEPRILKIMDNGNYVHERYQKLFEDIGILLVKEIPITNDELRISGRIDALVSIENNVAIAEIKSCGDTPFNRMKESQKPDPKYVAQTQLYMHLTGINLAVIYVENKNNQDVLEFWLDYDKIYASNLIKKLATVLEYVDRQKIMTREIAAVLDLFMNEPSKLYKNSYDPCCYYCRYCEYNYYCYADS